MDELDSKTRDPYDRSTKIQPRIQELGGTRNAHLAIECRLGQTALWDQGPGAIPVEARIHRTLPQLFQQGPTSNNRDQHIA